jgi:hypothetical protein
MSGMAAPGGIHCCAAGKPMTAEILRENVRLARERLAATAEKHELTISHGKAPQIGPLTSGNRVSRRAGRMLKSNGGQHAPRAQSCAGAGAGIGSDRASVRLATRCAVGHKNQAEHDMFCEVMRERAGDMAHVLALPAGVPRSQ